MTSDVPPVEPMEGAGAAAPEGAVVGEASPEAIQISSLEDLRIKAPKLYDALMMGLAMAIISDQRRQLENFKSAQREMRR